MTEWILVALFLPFGYAPSTIALPGFVSKDECMTAGKTIDDNTKGYIVRYSCVSRTKQ